jgi:hypothetical protein
MKRARKESSKLVELGEHFGVLQKCEAEPDNTLKTIILVKKKKEKIS